MYTYKISNIKTSVLNEGIDNKTLTIKSKKVLSVSKIKNILNKKYNSVTDFICEGRFLPSAVDRLDKANAEDETKLVQLRTLRQKRAHYIDQLRKIEDQVNRLDKQIKEIEIATASYIDTKVDDDMERLNKRNRY